MLHGLDIMRTMVSNFLNGVSDNATILPRKRAMVWYVVAVCLCLVLQTAPALAGNVTYQTRLSATQAYDDNLFLVDDNGQ